MQLFSTLSSAVRVPLEDSGLIFTDSTAITESALGIQRCNWGQNLARGRHLNMYAWQYLVTDFLIMGGGRVRGTAVLPFEPPATTHTLWIMGCWNDHAAGQPFFSHCSGCEPLMVLTALAVSNVFLYTPKVIKRTILAIGLKKKISNPSGSETRREKRNLKRGFKSHDF